MSLGPAADGAPTPDAVTAVRVHADDARPAREPGVDLVRRCLCADVDARFRRGRGEEVEFGLGIQASSAEVEAAATRQGAAPDELIERYRERLQARLGGLGISCAVDPIQVTASPGRARGLQAAFAALVERSLVYRLGGSWFFRSGRFAAWCERGLERLDGWTPAALAAQREALRRVDGVDLAATLLGTGGLVVFATSAESVAGAEFIAISPRHPEAERIAGAEALAQLRRQQGVAAVQTALQGSVSGIGTLLPVVLTQALEAETAATAALGVPAESEAARAIAGRLRRGGGLPMRAGGRGEKPKPASRFGLPDLAVSRPGGWGTPVPVLRCGSCGDVPVAGPDAAASANCPRCGAAAEQDPGVLSPEFESMWSWLSGSELEAVAATLAPAAPGGATPGAAPAPTVVLFGDADGTRLLHQRIAAAVARGIDPDSDPGDEPTFAAASVVAPVDTGAPECVAGIDALDALAARAGADVVRFALLDAAGAGTATALREHSVRHAERFLAAIRAYAEPRLAGGAPAAIDPGTRLRRRLRAWCRIAAERVAAALEQLDAKRALHELALFRRRIEDFEQRAAGDGEPLAADREAVAFALARWAELAAPCLPGLAAELADLAGRSQGGAVPAAEIGEAA